MSQKPKQGPWGDYVPAIFVLLFVGIAFEYDVFDLPGEPAIVMDVTTFQYNSTKLPNPNHHELLGALTIFKNLIFWNKCLFTFVKCIFLVPKRCALSTSHFRYISSVKLKKDGSTRDPYGSTYLINCLRLWPQSSTWRSGPISSRNAC